MKFEINNTNWEIEEVNELDNGVLGETRYTTQEIKLLKNQPNVIKTLKHELAHVWMFEYGHNQNDNKIFKYEDVCEIVSSSNDFINKIIDNYRNSYELYTVNGVIKNE